MCDMEWADHGDKSILLRRGAHHVLHGIDRGDLDKIMQPVMVTVEDAAPSFEVLQKAQEALDTIRSLRNT
jgi:hypothetical protein